MQENKLTFIDINVFPAMLLTAQGSIIRVNHKLENLLNISAEKLINKSILSVFKLETCTTEVDLFTFPINSHVFARFMLQGDEEIAVQLIISDLDEDNLLSVIVTENEMYHYNKDMLSSLNQLNLAVEGANIGIWQYGINDQKVSFSPKFRQLINLAKPIELLTWQDFVDLIYPEDKEIFKIFFKNHIHNNIPLDFEFRVLIHDKLHWFHIKGEVFYQQQKKYCVMGTLIDITVAKDTLHKLNQVIVSRRLAMEVGKIGGWHVELKDNGEWQWSWDEMTNKLFGLLPEDVGNIEKWQNIIHPDDRDNIISTLIHSLKIGRDFVQHYRAILPNGEIRYFVSKAKVSQNIHGRSYRIDGICIDESAIHQVQNQLKKLNNELESKVEERTKELKLAMEQAERASQTKSDFLSMMSHELRTPMNAVIGSLDLLATTEQTVESMDLIDTAKTSAENLVCILNDILDISKIEAGKLLLEEKPFALSEVIDNIVKVFVPTAQKRDIIFKIKEDADIPMYIKGDSMRVRQILYNIIGNALKFTKTEKDKQGIVELHARVVESNPFISTISFKVIDNGIGIDKQVQKILFSPFTQAERSTTRKFGGTGLGLAICAKLTKMMGGRIILTSEIGKGSCFEIELPFCLSQETNALDVELLSAAKVCLLNSTTDMVDKQTICEQYITASGAIVSKYNLAEINFDDDLYQCDFDVLVILVGELPQDKDLIINFITQLNKNSQILIAVKTLDIPLAKKLFQGVRITNLDTLTKVQLIDLIKKIKESGYRFDFDDFDFSFRDEVATTNDLESEFDDLTLDDLPLEHLKLASGQTKPCQVQRALKGGILVVEDNPLNQKLIKQQLTKLGYTCDVANDGEEGKQMWLRGNYTLILTDCHMPVMDGYQMVQHIRKLEQEKNKTKIPIIAVTGAAMSGDDEKCFQAGMSDFVSKPIQLADLKKILIKWYKHE